LKITVTKKELNVLIDCWSR